VVESSKQAFVRPTKRCLDDLGLSFPTLDESLSELEHPLVKRAQLVPKEAEAGGVERLRVLTDRVWFKCKTTVYRGAVTRLTSSESRDRGLPDEAAWWIGAAGERKQDSRSDFYSQLEREATREGKGTRGVSSVHLLPQEIDCERFAAEVAVQAVQAIREVVLTLIVKSLHDGRTYAAELRKHRIAAMVRAADGAEAYLAIGAEGFPHADLIAIILDAVPGIKHDDWQPEPGGVVGITPRDGQIIWSTIIPPEIQADILERFDESGQSRK
jgi:hypothetical protein